MNFGPVFLFLALLCSASAAELSPEGRTVQADHTFLFDQVAKQHPSLISEDGFLREVGFFEGSLKVEGSAQLPLPPDISRVLNQFYGIELFGEGLDGITHGTLSPVAADRKMTMSRKGPGRLNVKTLNLPIFDGKRHAFVLHLHGRGTVHKALLVARGKGVSPKLDLSNYTNLGYDRPPRELELRIDLTRERAIEGIVALDRSKWFRYYGRPNAVPPRLEALVRDKGFLPGRQMVKFRYALEEGYDPKQPKLGEDPDRPGYADPAFFEQFDDRLFAGVDPEMRFAMCMNYWPSFMAVGGKDVAQGRGTPKDYPAAAELVVRYLKNQVKHSGRSATWWEVKNESTIKHEWAHHYVQGVDSWKLLADFHNTVADAVHAEVPGVQIGGPASAWMQLQVGGFDLWRKQQRFMDQTRGRLDFYSHHFYEDVGTLDLFNRRWNGYTNYLYGRMDAILDMTRAHMLATDNLRPILITEYGMLNIGTRQSDYWQRLRTFSAYLVQLMDWPHQVELAVPFVSITTPWEPKGGYAMVEPKAGKRQYAPDPADYERTPNALFLDLWEGVQGRRVPLHSPERWLRGQALRDGDTLYLALSNLRNDRARVKLVLNGEIASITQRRLYHYDGTIRYEVLEANPEAVLIDVEETTVLILKLKDAPKPSGVWNLRSFYAPDTAVKGGERKRFTIAVPESGPRRQLWLRLGLQRDEGIDGPVKGWLNGHAFEIDTGYSRGVDRFWEPVRHGLPVEWLKAGDNLLELHVPHPEAFISSIALELEEESE